MIGHMHHENENIEDLEIEIKERIDFILTGKFPGFETRPLKSGSLRQNPIHLFGPARIPVQNPVQLNMDRLANIITSFVEDSGIGLSPAIKNVILIPRFIIAGERFLTHIYDPCTQGLIFYLYPLRLHSPVETSIASRFQDSVFQFPGIFPTLIDNIIESHRHSRRNNSTKRMHHFLIPLSSITEEEHGMLLQADEVGKALMEDKIGY